MARPLEFDRTTATQSALLLFWSKGYQATLRSFFLQPISEEAGERWAWGCMLVNTVLELAGVDDALCAHARRRLAEVEAAFEACLSDTGCGAAKAAELSAFLMVVNEGLRVSSRRALPQPVHRAQIETTFRLLESTIA